MNTPTEPGVYLLEHPQLAKVFSYVVREGPVDLTTIRDALDMPRSPLSDRIEELQDLGVVSATGDAQPVAYDTEWLDTDGEISNGELVRVSTPLIAAVGRRSIDEDIDLFLERHDIGKLAEALEYTHRINAGELTQRMAADDLGLHAAEGMAIFAALQDVLDTFDHQTADT